MKKRRVFDIDLPEEASPPAAATPERGGRRGPMAAAARESAESLRARAELEASIRAENDQLARELVRLRGLGLIVEPIALDLIDAEKLLRDRVVEDQPDVEDLKESLRAIGLSNPIRVEQSGERYELIQGWRRLHAYRELFEETGDQAWAAIPAGIVAPGDDLETSYRRMVDENLVRKNVSFAEMAELARAYAADPQTECRDVDQAVAALFRSASYQKRSYIRAFAELLSIIGDRLLHARHVPRNLGLEVRRRLMEEGGADELRESLDALGARGVEEELAALRRFAEGRGRSHGSSRAGSAGGPAGRTRRGSLQIEIEGAMLRCDIGEGRVSLRGPGLGPDCDAERLEAALKAFYAVLNE